jgi:hypothetical protein
MGYAAAADQSDGYKDGGLGFLYCQEFTRRILAEADIMQEKTKLRRALYAAFSS